MADFSNNVETTFVADAAKLISGLREAARAAGELGREADSVKAKTRKLFAPEGSGALEAVESAKRLQKEYTDLENAAKTLRTALKNATNPDSIRDYTKFLAQAEAGMARLANAAKASGVTLQTSLQKQAEAIRESTKGTSLAKEVAGEFFGAFGKATLIAGAVIAVKNFTVEAVKAAATYERFQVLLAKQLGSDFAAKKAFAELEEFATKTPLQLEEVVGAFLKLKQRGIEPTKQVMSGLTDVAVASNKSLDQLVEAILDAQIGEFERLKEFGVVVRRVGQDFKVQFGTLEPVLLKSASAVAQYVAGLNKLPQIAGAATVVSETMAGALSNLVDNWKGLLAALGGSTGVFKSVVNGLSSMVGYFKDLVSTPLSEKLADEQAGFKAVITAISNTNDNQRVRNLLIEEANRKYPEYLKNIDLNKATEEDLQKLLRATNSELDKRVLTLARQEILDQVSKDVAAQLKLAADLEKSRGKGISAIFEGVTDYALNRVEQDINQIVREGEEAVGRIDARLGKATKQGSVRGAAFARVNEERRANAESEAKAAEDAARIEKQGEAERAKAAIEAADKRREKAQKEAEERARLELEKQRLVIDALTDGLEKELALENFKFDQLRKEYEKHKLDTAAVERQRQQAITDIQAEFFVRRLDAARKAAEEEAAAQAQFEGDFSGAVKQGAADRLDLGGTQFEAGLLAARRVFFEKKRSDAEIEAYEKNVARLREVFQLETQAKELENQLLFEQDLTDIQREGIQKRIENLREQAKQVAEGIGEKAGKPDKPFTIFSLLGLDENDSADAAMIERIKLFTDQAVSSLGEISDARIEAAEIARRAADEQVSLAEDALEKEKQLAEEGFASNVTLREEELARAKEAQRQAIESQRDAARKQLSLDTAIQASSLITAAANIFKGFSGLPVIGQILAVGQIGLMIAAFITAKAKAFQVVNAQQFRHGGQGRVDSRGRIVGPSHEGGGVRIEAEGREFFTSDGQGRFAIVNRRATDEHFDLLDAINRDDRPAMRRHLERMTEGLETARRNVETSLGTAASDAMPQPGKSAAEKPRGISRDEIDKSRRLEQMERHLAEMNRRERERETVEHLPDRTIRRRGNTETHVLK